MISRKNERKMYDKPKRNTYINKLLFMCIDKIKKLSYFFGAVQMPTQNTCTAYDTIVLF